MRQITIRYLLCDKHQFVHRPGDPSGDYGTYHDTENKSYGAEGYGNQKRTPSLGNSVPPRGS